MSERLTDEYLEQLLVWADKGDLVEAGIVRDLVAEVRRLRSDEWLEKAAEELGPHLIQGEGWVLVHRHAREILAILRKHREGE